MSKEYHFGVVAIFDEDTCTWEFETTTLGGDGPFVEMYEEVYDQGPDDEDAGEWQRASMDAEDGSVEHVNFLLLMEAIAHAQHRLSNPGWEP